MPTYLISLAEGDMLELAEGADAVQAVERYYGEQDALCGSSDDLTDEGVACTLLLPEEIVSQARHLIMEPGEGALDRIEAMVASRGPVRWATLDVVFSRGEHTVTMRD